MLTGRRRRMAESEAAFQRWVTDVATALGWTWWHCPTPMRPIGGNRFVPDPRGRGLCDLIMMHTDPPRMIFAEVKGEKGVLSDDQEEFLGLARAVAKKCYGLGTDAAGLPTGWAPFSVFVWRPANRDLIEATLRG